MPIGLSLAAAPVFRSFVFGVHLLLLYFPQIPLVPTNSHLGQSDILHSPSLLVVDFFLVLLMHHSLHIVGSKHLHSPSFVVHFCLPSVLTICSRSRLIYLRPTWVGRWRSSPFFWTFFKNSTTFLKIFVPPALGLSHFDFLACLFSPS